MKKICYIISDISRSIAFEWIASSIDKKKFSLSFILLNPGQTDLENYLLERGFEVHRIRCRGKKDWPSAIIRTYRVIKKIKPDVVHCHLIQANVIGLTAAKLAGVKKRIYTRHHSSEHHIYFPKGIWWDKLSNKLATHIIAISSQVKKVLIDWERADNSKVSLIPHGFMLKQFVEVEPKRVEDFANRNTLNGKSPIIGVVSRFTSWKGVQYIIRAFKKFLAEYPNSTLILLNARGNYESAIREQLSELPAQAYRLIKFEKDIAAAYKAMDIFIHVPINEHSEAFGQIYIEALAAGIPSIVTKSGIACDFISDRENALVVPYKDSETIYMAMEELWKDVDLRHQLKQNGKTSISDKFDLPVMIQNLEALYAAE